MHPLLRIGAVNETPHEIFRNEISTRLARIVEGSPGTVIMLAPSVRDMVSRHLAFPQGALERDGLGLPKVRSDERRADGRKSSCCRTLASSPSTK